MKKENPQPESKNTTEEKAIKRSNGKIWTGFLVALLLVVGLIATSTLLKKQQDVRQRASEQTVVEDEILLKFRPGAKKNIQDKILNENGLTVKAEIPQIEVKVIKVAPQARDHVIEALSHNPAVDFAESNLITKPLDIIPNDPQFTLNQWNLYKIQMPKAWEITTGAPNIAFAVLDTGVDPIDELKDKLVRGYNFVANNTDTTDDNWHGTSVASVATATTNNGISMAGVSWLSQIMPVKVCDAAGYCATGTVANGIVFAADQGARVINMSLGGSGTCSSTFQSAIDYAWSKGAFLTAAAGNDGGLVLQPANCKNVVAVGATEQTDTRETWSNYGPTLDVTAPGETIVCLTLSGSGQSSCSGTSVATPHVAGLASLLFAKGANNSTATSAIIQGVDDLGDPGFDQYYGYGRINALKSLQLLTGATPPPADTTPPTTSITNLAGGSTVSGDIVINADATDITGVAKVELYVDGGLYATDITSPYSFFLNTPSLSNGNHVLMIKAYDVAGNVGSSQSVTVTISNLTPTPTAVISTPSPTRIPTITIAPTSGSNDTQSPIVSITNPLGGAIVAVRSNVNIQATASDNVGVIRVEFYINGSLTCTDTSATYTCSWKVPGAKNKNYTIQAKALDGAGNSSTASISVSAK